MFFLMADRYIAPRILARGEIFAGVFGYAFWNLFRIGKVGKVRRRFVRALYMNAIRAEIFYAENFCCAAKGIISTEASGGRVEGGSAVFAHWRIAGSGIASLRFWRRVARASECFFRYFSFLSFAPRNGFAMILQVIRACARGKSGGNL